MTAEGLACDLSGYESTTALLTAIQDGAQFHILLLDVMMEGLDGMELAAALRKLGDSTAIIFISSNRELALRGYEVSAARYLAKPLQPEQLREALLYCYKTFCEKKKFCCPRKRARAGWLPPASSMWNRGSAGQGFSSPADHSKPPSEFPSWPPCCRSGVLSSAIERSWSTSPLSSTCAPVK